jgi:hypothetical protein
MILKHYFNLKLKINVNQFKHIQKYSKIQLLLSMRINYHNQTKHNQTIFLNKKISQKKIPPESPKPTWQCKR